MVAACVAHHKAVGKGAADAFGVCAGFALGTCDAAAAAAAAGWRDAAEVEHASAGRSAGTHLSGHSKAFAAREDRAPCHTAAAAGRCSCFQDFAAAAAAVAAAVAAAAALPGCALD